MPPQRITGAPATKLLITAASIAATIGGWASIASQQPAADPSADLAQPTAELVAAIAPQPPAWLLATPVIPALPELVTVASVPTQQPGLVAQSKPSVPAAKPSAPAKPAVIQPAPVQVAPTAAPAQAAPAPAQAAPAPAKPALRQVAAPKVRTRSSK